MSKRELKRQMLFDELNHWDLFIATQESSDVMSALATIANELPWRFVMRIINKLQRKRGLVNEIRFERL